MTFPAQLIVNAWVATRSLQSAGKNSPAPFRKISRWAAIHLQSFFTTVLLAQSMKIQTRCLLEVNPEKLDFSMPLDHVGMCILPKFPGPSPPSYFQVNVQSLRKPQLKKNKDKISNVSMLYLLLQIYSKYKYAINRQDKTMNIFCKNDKNSFIENLIVKRI